MPVLLRAQGLEDRALVREVRARAEVMLSALGLSRCELSVLLCDDPTIHALNRSYRRKNAPTDVLAFPLLEGAELAAIEKSSPALGDIVISIPTADRQAREHARSLRDEVALLLAHGLLHLLGLDHRDRTEERRMNARTDLLRAARVPRDRGGSRLRDRRRSR